MVNFCPRQIIPILRKIICQYDEIVSVCLEIWLPSDLNKTIRQKTLMEKKFKTISRTIGTQGVYGRLQDGGACVLRPA